MPSMTLYGPITGEGAVRRKIAEIQFLRAAAAATGIKLSLLDAKRAVDSWEPNEPRHLPVLSGTEDVIRLAAKAAGIQTVKPEFRPSTWLFGEPDDLDTLEVPC